jgi:hypothetical protein
MLKPRFKLVAALALTMGALLVAAAPVAAGGEAMVRVLHASPDAGTVDVYVDSTTTPAIEDFAFGTLSGYLALPAGAHDFRVCAANSDASDDANCPIIANDVALDAGAMVTVAAIGFAADPGATETGNGISASILVDSAPNTEAAAWVRVVHFSPDTPAVDVLLEDGTPTGIEGLAYPNNTGYVPLPGGSYDLKVCAAADNSICPDPVNPGALALANGTSYTVFAIGSSGLDLESGEPQGDVVTLVVGNEGQLLADTAMEAPAPGWPAVLTVLGLGTLGLAGILTGRRLATRSTDGR